MAPQRGRVSARAIALALLVLCGLAAGPADAQVDKPSAYTAARRGMPMAAASAAAAHRNAVPFLAKVPDRATFASLARVYEPGTPYAIEHVLFVVEPGRGAKPDRVFFVNTQRYALDRKSVV